MELVNQFIIKLRQWLHFSQLKGKYHFIAIPLILTFLTFSSKRTECYLLGILSVGMIIYIFINHKLLGVFTIIITISIVFLFGIKLFVYNSADLTLNKKLIVKDIENKETYQKVIFSNGIYKYIYYNKDITKLTFNVGDIYIINGQVIKQQGSNVPNGFDYAKYLKYQNIVGLIEIENINYVKNIFIISKIHNSLVRYYEKNFEHSDIIKALVIGNKNGIDEELMNNIQMVGISHLFVVSGLHVGILTGVLSFLLGKVKLSNKKRNLIIYMFLGAYLIITNFMVSVLRVSVAYVLKNILNKDFTPLDKIVINMIIVLMINPFYIYSYSFILTYLISSTIIIISPLLRKKKGIIPFITNMLIVSIASMIITLPIVIRINPNINILSLIYNVIYIPMVSYILLPLSIIITFVPFLEPYVSFIYNLFNQSVIYLSKLTLFSFSFPTLSNVETIFYYLNLLFVIYMIEKKKSYFILMFILYLFCWYNKAYIDVKDKIVFLDIPEGDATHIKTHFNKCNILVDTGIEDNTLITYLKNQGVRTIDLVIISHGDNDHNGNLENLIKNFKIKKVILSYFDYNTHQILIKNNFNNYAFVRKGDVFKINNILFEILWPVKDMKNVNNNSIVFKMSFSNTTYLFTGDIEKEVEEKIIDMEKKIDVDVLKIAHHGSNTSTHNSWLEGVNFDIGVAMTGDKNTFGFPNKYTVKRLEKKEIIKEFDIEYYRNILKENSIIGYRNIDYVVKPYSVRKPDGTIKTKYYGKRKKHSKAVKNA